MARSFAKIPMGQDDMLFTSNIGSRVNKNPGIVDTAMHPA
jgi:hypothetical protein